MGPGLKAGSDLRLNLTSWWAAARVRPRLAPVAATSARPPAWPGSCDAASAHVAATSARPPARPPAGEAELSSLRWRHAAGDVADGRTDTADAAADVAGGDVGGDAGGRGGVPLLRSALGLPSGCR